MKKKIFQSILFTNISIVLIAAFLFITGIHSYILDENKSKLADEAIYISVALNGIGEDFLEDVLNNTADRITILTEDGIVAYDSSQKDIYGTDIYAECPEIISAFETGFGEDTRISDIAKYETYYYAIKLEESNYILRLSIEIESVLGIVDDNASLIFTVFFLLIIISALIANKVTKLLIDPINKLNLDEPLLNNTYEELSPLLLRMDLQNKKIGSQVISMKNQQKEFDKITDTMSEGLVIFNKDKQVLSANKSAREIFSRYSFTNQNYIEFCRDINFTRCVEEGFLGEASSKIEKNGRIYDISVSKVKNSGGAVLLAVDVTEKYMSDNMRREFSANVSHELKTPLTSIMGYAEIMSNQIAKPQDYPRFSNLIYNEAKRLLALIEDIIKLSRLDEAQLKKEFKQINVYEIASKVRENLSKKASDHNINLSLEGEVCFINGIESTIYETIFNLADNAISYNKDDGFVKMSLLSTDKEVILMVEDNGIGIAEKDRVRIFERFYRADKSHSKSTGGTGLGLSIVKHAISLHDAQIKLDSKLGVGTKFTVIFKKA